MPYALAQYSGEGNAQTTRSCASRSIASTNHAVSMTSADLARYAPGGATPDDLVRRSFEFLLAREPKDSILRQFDLAVIGRYFPDYEAAITRPR